MKPNEDQTTLPWTQQDIELIQRRLRESKRLLAAFPGPLAAPALLRQLAVTQTGDAEALLLPRSVVVGRSGDPPFQFPQDQSLSSHHFRVLVGRNGHCYAEDLGSTNGLWINGRRVDHRLLRHGDLIHAGNQDWVFHDGQPEEGEEYDPAGTLE